MSLYLVFAIITLLASAQTTGTLLVFLLAMVLNPEIQAKAQAEIDRVIGKDRLPDFDDRPALPFVDAILRETLRWHPVFPLGTYTYHHYSLALTDCILRYSTRDNDR